MLQGISTTVSSLPLASMGCTAAGLFLAKDFIKAVVDKTASIGADLIASKNAAEWKQASNESFALAKKNGFRNLTAAAGLIAIGVTSFASQNAAEKAPQKEESGFFQNYGLPTLKGVGLVGFGWILKNRQVHRALDLAWTPIQLNGKTVKQYDMKAYKANIYW